MKLYVIYLICANFKLWEILNPMQGIKLTFIPGSHLAPKYFKVVANSKTLVAIMTHTHKNNFYPVTVLARATKRTLEWVIYSVKGYLTPRFTFEIMHLLHSGNELNEELFCRFILINLQQSLDF